MTPDLFGNLIFRFIRYAIRSLTGLRLTPLIFLPAFLQVLPLAGQEPLTLSAAIAIGLENNFSILLQRNEAQIAKNDNTLGNAGFLPEISLNGTQNTTISNTHQEQFSGTVRDVKGARNTTLNAAVQLNWTLFDGMNMFVSKKMLNALEDLGENGTRIVVEDVVSDIILTWYGIIQLEKLVRVARDAVDLSSQRKYIAKAKLSLGSGSQLMLLQSTVDLNADSTLLIRQITLFENTKADFNRLLARDVLLPVTISDSIRLDRPVNYDTLLQHALAQNTLLLEARMNQELARLGVREAQAERYPVLGLTASYGYNQLNAATGFLKYNRSFGPAIGFSLSYNLFNGFNVNRMIRDAKVLLNSGELSLQDAEQEMRAGILKLYNEYRSNREVVKMQLTNVEVARENVNVAFEKYKLGSINDIELREIQQKLIDAEYQLILSTFDAKKAEVGLFRLSGDLLRQAGL